jgi:hypothetical protein
MSDFTLIGGATFVALLANAAVFIAISAAQRTLRARIATLVKSS